MVAEGVETPNQYRQLRLLGCRLFQGFLFSKPLTAERFEREFLKDHHLHRGGLFAAITSAGAPPLKAGGANAEAAASLSEGTQIEVMR